MTTDNQDPAADSVEIKTQALIEEIKNIVPLMERLGCMPGRVVFGFAGGLYWAYIYVGDGCICSPSWEPPTTNHTFWKFLHSILTREAEDYLNSKSLFYLETLRESGGRSSYRYYKDIDTPEYVSLLFLLTNQCKREGKS